jgi:prophage antirepressor-like protein
MTSLTQFAFNSQQVRIVSINNEPWFVATDVCEILEIRNVSQAINRLDDDEKDTIILNEGNRGNPNAAIISESGLYSLTLGSRKPQAKDFKRWVTREILPTIRKTGKYEIVPTQPTLPQSFSEALRLLAAEVEAKEALEKEIKILVPKAEVYDTVMDSETWLDVRELFKCLALPKYKEKDFRAFLANRDVKILSKDTNQPYADWIQRGLAKLTPVTLPNGAVYNKPVFSWKGCEKVIQALRGHGVIADSHQINLNLGYKVVKV